MHNYHKNNATMQKILITNTKVLLFFKKNIISLGVKYDLDISFVSVRFT